MLVVFQLRGSQILEAARLYRFGFPESMALAEFQRRFALLATCDTNREVTVEHILASNEVDTATYRIGPSQVSDSSHKEIIEYRSEGEIFKYNR